MAKANKEGQVLARVIIEILGAPKEHIDKSLREFVGLLKDDRDVEVVKEDYAEPVPTDKLFTTFVELEVWFKNLPRLLTFCFEAMPSSVEILEPSVVHLGAMELSGYINDLQAKLHTVDMALKNLKAELEVLTRNADAIFKNLISLSLKNSPKGLSDLSQDTGIKETELEPLLRQLVTSNYLKQIDNKYQKR